MKTKHIIIVAFTFLILISSAFAIDFTIEMTSVQNDIFLDESAEFNLTIINIKDEADVYQAYTTDIGWYISTSEPLGLLEPGEKKEITVKLTPNAWATIGPQKITFIIKSRNGETKQQSEIPIFVKPWDYVGREYVPSFELRLTIPEIIDPRAQSVPVEINMRNRNRLNAEGMKLIIKSSFFNKERIINIAPLEERSEEFSFPIDKLTQPQDIDVEAILFFKNNSISSKRKTVKITEYSDLIKTEETNKYFFKETKEIKIVNDGNVMAQEKYKVPMTFWEAKFSKGNPEPSVIKENGKKYFIWDLNLNPQEEYKINLDTNYRLVPYLFFIIIISFALYYINRSPIVSKKNALIISTPSGGISELKIVLHIKNRTQELINNIHITDKIPKLAELVKESSIGTIEPTKILKHDRKGTLSKWEIPNLEPYEERVITYRTRSKLNIVGGIVLPAYKVKFDTKNGKERVIYSNKCDVRIEY